MVRHKRMSKRAYKHTGSGMRQQPVARSKERASLGAISTKRL